MVRVTNGIERDGEKSKEIEGQRMMAHSAGGRSWKELERTGNRVPQAGVVGPAGNAEGSRGAGSNGLLQRLFFFGGVSSSLTTWTAAGIDGGSLHDQRS